MKLINLISFFYKDSFDYINKDNLNDIIEGLKWHIDHLIDYGWKKEDLIIKTNFPFTYKDISAQPFYYQKCDNLFLTKIIAAYEVLKENPETIVWQHDNDTYQIRAFDKEHLSKHIINDVNLCNYWPGNSRPQGASVFYKFFSPTLQDMYLRIVSKNINLCDELFFMYYISHYNHSISLDLPYEYNTSITRYTHSKRSSKEPYCIHGDTKRRFDKKLFHRYMDLYK